MIKKFIKDERGGGSAAMAVKVVVLSVFITLLMFVLIDIFALFTIYAYVKDQQDLANRAVYAAIDPIKLADRELYIDENLGKQQFITYIKKILSSVEAMCLREIFELWVRLQ